MIDRADLCLVTGGAGFIGSNLVRALVGEGIRARVLDDLSTGRAANLDGLGAGVDFIQGDLRDRQAVGGAMKGVAVVFHLGAVPSVARSVADPVTSNEVNITGTLNMLMAARDAGCRRVVFASSSAVYGEQTTLPLHEELVCRPISPYGVTKLAGERYMKAFFESYGLPTVSLRFFNVYGPRQNPLAEYAAVVPRFIRAGLEGVPVTIFGDGQQSRDFVFVGDVVRACTLAVHAPAEAWGGVYNVAAGEPHTVSELASAISGLVPGEHPPPVFSDARPGDVRRSHADVGQARGVLGYSPEHSFEDGLDRTVEWFLEQRGRGLL